MDIAILEFINQVATTSTSFDRLVAELTANKLLKGGVIVALFFWSWFSVAPDSRERNALLVTLLCAPVIVLLARLLALLLPFRLRPIHNDDLSFTIPAGIPEGALEGWSSFPSDHAILYFAIALGIYVASKRIGYVAISYTLVFIGLPRIYAGYHYPTDILAGLIIGGTLVLLAIRVFGNSAALNCFNSLSKRHPGPFHALLFLLGYQIANLFDESRQIAAILFQTVNF